jgi:hypothetical protein
MKALLLALLAAPAFSQVTYDYTGAPYDSAGDVIAGFIDLPYQLEPSSTTILTPAIQSFGINQVSSNPGIQFTLTTNASDAIVGWDFSGSLNFACSCSVVFTSSNTSFDTVSLIKFNYPTYGDVTETASNSSGPGSWSPAPELDPSGGIAATALLGGIILVLKAR